MKLSRIMIAALLAGLALAAGAQNNANSNAPAGSSSNQGMRPGDQAGSCCDRPHGPPPEAVAACKGKNAGAVCNFADREGVNLSGTCFAPPAGRPNANQGAPGNTSGPGQQVERPIACRPDRGGQGAGDGRGR